jgi:hypothetical protein
VWLSSRPRDKVLLVIQHDGSRVTTGHEIDRLIDETVRTIANLFSGVEFTAEEQRFIEDAGRKLMECSFEALVQWPKVGELRPFVVLFAIAALLGNHQIFADGIPALRREATRPPRPDAG